MYRCVLSGSLLQLIDEIICKYSDPIAIEIKRVNCLVEEYTKISEDYFPTIKDQIKKDIDDSLNTDISMLSVRINTDDFEVSFLPGDKEPEYTANNVWSRKNRQSGKPGKIFQKLLKKEFKTKDWEVFVNRFKSQKCCSMFQLVSGEEIRYWYNYLNYYDVAGTLGSSCMRYDDAAGYFDIYVDNAKMLITTKDGKLTGRAIVWEMPDGIILLDRIYTCFDYLTNCFIEYAKENKWWIRENNSLLHTGSDQWWYSPDDDYKEPRHRQFILYPKERYEYYPYLDSFRYYNSKENFFTTVCVNGYDYADSTDGDITYRQEYRCAECGAVYYGYDDECPQDMVWSDYIDDYLCIDCSWWCEALDDYIPSSEEAVDVYNAYTSIEYPKSWVDDNLIKEPNGNEFGDDVIKIDGKYYFVTERIKWNSETKKYEIRSDSD